MPPGVAPPWLTSQRFLRGVAPNYELAPAKPPGRLGVSHFYELVPAPPAPVPVPSRWICELKTILFVPMRPVAVKPALLTGIEGI